MSLRARILALFLGLGVVPILLLGVIGYARSMSAVRGLLEAQTSNLARQAASEIQARHELRLSELLLLAENAETQRLFRANLGQAATPPDQVIRQATSYLQEAWSRFGSSYQDIQLRDRAGRTLLSLSGGEGVGPFGAPTSSLPSGVSPTARLLVPVLDLEGGDSLGSVDAAVRLRVILPYETLETVFGGSGYTVVLDRRQGDILYHPSRRFVNQPLSSLHGPDGWDTAPEALATSSGSFRYREADSTRVASFVSLESPPWTVVSTAALDEFASPFRGTRRGDLLIVLLLAALVAGAFLVSTRRATASLEALTDASERVGRGDLNPPLPPPGPDEVGRLSEAFGLMVGEVRQMLQRVEETRQMAIMGEFASGISHEIRNPLTSIKLNLQGLEQEAHSEGMSDPSVRSLKICLREVAHLEEAVRKILDMARTHPPVRVASSLHGILSSAVELLRTQLDSQGVGVTLHLAAEDDSVLADPAELKSVFVNLLVNAQEAMPNGGAVSITSTNPVGSNSESVIRVSISDEGPGIPEEVREQIFRPFVTTKAEGTGFGLAIARVAAQEHEGRIWLEASETESGRDAPAGTTFVVEMPLHRETQPPEEPAEEDGGSR